MDKRSAFVVDAQGIIQYAKVYEPGTIPESKEPWNSCARFNDAAFGVPAICWAVSRPAPRPLKPRDAFSPFAVNRRVSNLLNESAKAL